MKKHLILVFIPLLFVSCLNKKDAALTVRGNFGESTAFELGYVSDFIVEEVISGELNALGLEPGGNTIKLIFPAVDTPELYVNVNPDIDQVGYIIEFVSSGKNLEDMELFSPSPGSGMGEFMPPGLLMENQIYYLISKIEGIDP